jgi:hypothetical protein
MRKKYLLGLTGLMFGFILGIFLEGSFGLTGNVIGFGSKVFLGFFAVLGAAVFGLIGVVLGGLFD